jgi:hypothetical protein
MSNDQLGLVAAALSSLLNTPIKTYDDYVASGYDVESAQFLDLSAVHGNSLMLIRPSEEEDNPKLSKGLITYSTGKPDIQIFIKSLTGDSHPLFVSRYDTVLNLKHVVKKMFGYDTTKMRLEFASRELQDFRTLASYNIEENDNIYVLFRLLGGYDGYVVRNDFLAPSWNYDFTNINDNGVVYTRGRHVYKRPCGWKRIALNVLTKYGPDHKWLGCVGDSPDEWPVTYHGTPVANADSIADNGYRPSPRGSFGPGVYSSPELSYAENYALIFLHNNVNYKLIIQNRINPNVMVKHNNNEWVVPNGDGLRPYGMCFKAC